MSGNINEAAHDETAAAGDAASRSSAEAAALTAGSTPPEQQLHSGSASRLSPKVKGGIIALLAASVLLVSVGVFALTGGFDGQGGSSAQSSSQEAQTTEQGRVAATKVTGEVEASALLEMRYYTKSTGAGGGNNEKWHENLLTPARFFYNRYSIVEEELEKKYGSEFGRLKLKTEGEGEVKISTLTVSGERELRYLSGLEVPVEAIPAKGWRLASLKYDSKEISDSFYMRGGDRTLTAVFEPDPDYTEPTFGLVINEIKYESPRSDTSPDMV